MAVKAKENPYIKGPIEYIYTPDDRVTGICNEFINKTNIDVSISTGFMTMLKYISQNIPKIENKEIEKMDYYFGIYIYITSTCKILPDLTGFCIMIDISYDTLMEWLSGQCRSSTHQQVVKKWRDFCKGSCLADAGSGNVGAIYVSKAIHGLSDQAPAAQLTQNNLYINAPVSREAIAAELGGMIGQKGTAAPLPEIIDVE